MHVIKTETSETKFNENQTNQNHKKKQVQGIPCVVQTATINVAGTEKINKQTEIFVFIDSSLVCFCFSHSFLAVINLFVRPSIATKIKSNFVRQ